MKRTLHCFILLGFFLLPLSTLAEEMTGLKPADESIVNSNPVIVDGTPSATLETPQKNPPPEIDIETLTEENNTPVTETPNTHNTFEIIPTANQRIAILLPMSGKFSAAGKAVQNGFMSAYYHALESQSTPASIQLYDTNAHPNIQQLYNQALNDGATFIIGPLSKEEVSQLQNREHFPVPTLALNYGEGSHAADNFFQFGISPQDEAIQVAEHALRANHRHALVIAPDDEWGHGVAESFTMMWLSQGGTIIDRLDYKKNEPLDSQIRTILEVDQSEKRINKLQHVLHTHLQATAHRRQDIDAVFVVATPMIARQINPLLKFYYAGDLPVYAPSTIYSGNSDPLHDRDIENMHFCDMPWVLKPLLYQDIQRTINTLWPRSMKHFSRLYAIGHDSFILSQQMDQLIHAPKNGLPAASGRLILNDNLQISRRLLWARMRDGQSTLVNRSNA